MNKNSITLTPTQYFGQPAFCLERGPVRVAFLSQAGPRLVGLWIDGHPDNLLAETPELGWDTPWGQFHLWGGHRLWHAPEAPGRTSVPDDDGLEMETLEDGVRLWRAAEPPTGIAKSIEVHLPGDRPWVALRHRLENQGIWPVEVAAWAITLVPAGGLLVAPQPATAEDGAGLWPDRRLALWPYSRWNDPRLRLGEDWVGVEAIPLPRPFKIGLFCQEGWCEYRRDGLTLRKDFRPVLGANYPDGGCNVEMYAKGNIFELETLGPLVRLEPGQATEHEEVWEAAMA